MAKKEYKQELMIIKQLEDAMENIGLPPLREDCIKRGIPKAILKKMERQGLIKTQTVSLVKTHKETGAKTPLGGKCLIHLQDEARMIIGKEMQQQEALKQKQVEEEKARGANEVFSVDDLINQNKEVKGD